MKRMLLLLLLIPLCTGCAAVLPGEERAFAVALGIGGGAGAWTLHARIPTYNADGYATISATGDTLPHAWAALDAASPCEMHAGQLRLIVIGADAALSEDFPAVLAFLADRHDMRPGAALCVTQAELPGVMEALTPATGKRLSKALDALIDTRVRQGIAPRCTLADVLTAGERQSPVLMNLATDGAELVLEGGWAMGADGRVAASLTAAEVQLIALMQGRLTQGTVRLPGVPLRLTGASARVQLAGDLCHATVHLTLRCADAYLPQETNLQALADACVTLLDHLTAAGCDVLGLARQAVMRAGECSGVAWTVAVRGR